MRNYDFSMRHYTVAHARYTCRADSSGHVCFSYIFFFFFNDTATTEIYTLSLHDALPILLPRDPSSRLALMWGACQYADRRSEEHTSELQSRQYLVCRLLLDKTKNNKANGQHHSTYTPAAFVRHCQSHS